MRPRRRTRWATACRPAARRVAPPLFALASSARIRTSCRRVACGGRNRSRPVPRMPRPTESRWLVRRYPSAAARAVAYSSFVIASFVPA